MKKHIIFIFLTLMSATVLAQEYRLSGKITDDQNQPLMGATILVKNQNRATSSNFDGEYELKLNPGSTIVEVHYLGYEALEKEIELNQDQVLNFKLTSSIQTLEEVLVRAVRVDANSPITHSNLDKEELEKRNLGQDLPIMMNFLPSVVTTTDAGAGVGYTGIRVRGSDATRINVTLNGIPYNDAESQGTFWVNMPDFTSSVEDLQLQRGVGTSTNGSGAFGASINLQTDAVSTDSYALLSNSFGSFNTWKHTAKFSTGLIDDNFEMAGRLSKIKSDGYIDRAFTDLSSYYVHGAYLTDNTLIKAIVFGGDQQTYQAWNGVDAETMKDHRTFNSAGMYYDVDGNIKFYKDETDNYKQDHYQLHWNQRIDHAWSTNLSLNYTKGLGYFEQYREDDKFETYGMTPYEMNGEWIDRTDLIRRRWLDNNYFVVSSNIEYTSDDWDVTLGGFFSKYTGDHFGEVIWAEHTAGTSMGDRYYFSDAEKTEWTVFVKTNYNLNDKWQVFADIQGRFVNYQTKGLSSSIFELDIDKDFSFFNPKAGLSYQLSPASQFYASYAKAHREPNRQDFEEEIEEAESLDDWELGWRYKSNKFILNTNLYYMYYRNQLILTGELDDVGRPIRTSSGKSFRTGLEVDASWQLHPKFSWMANTTFSVNKNKDFVMDWDGELKYFGDTDLSFSPRIIASNRFSYNPLYNFNISLLSKYVGAQYMGNTQTKASKLEDYFVNDLQFYYIWEPKTFAKSITFSALINNIFNEKYSSNGFYYTYEDDYTNPGSIFTQEGTGYYPQAGTNFLLGISILF